MSTIVTSKLRQNFKDFDEIYHRLFLCIIRVKMFSNYTHSPKIIERVYHLI